LRVLSLSIKLVTLLGLPRLQPHSLDSPFGNSVMPVFGYFAIVGAVLVALFFLADATLEKGASPVVTSERVGLPKPWQPDPIQTLVSTPAPEPNMTTPEVLAAQPKTAAEAPKKKHVTRKRSPDDHYQQNQAWSRDRDRGPFGFFFGRF
jgi:hypothetical protein